MFRSPFPKLLGLSCAISALFACSTPVTDGAVPDGGAGGGSEADGGVDGGAALTCLACLGRSDCGGAPCVQYAGNDYCGESCVDANDCESGESCLDVVDNAGTQAKVCVPSNGACGTNAGCGSCAQNESCDPIAGRCIASQDAGQPAADGGLCGTYAAPASSSCCHSCTAGSGTCQTNGCYGGWWCDTAACVCHRPPTSCGGTDAGTTGSGGTDAGIPTGTVGNDGGTVSRLYFAVVGDTRPGSPDQNSSYPTAIITKIYDDLEAMSPRPQFVLGTGDYMFATPSGTNGATQLGYYVAARSHYTGPFFADLGNHECTGYTAGNCVGTTATSSNNYQSFLSSLVTPLGKSRPYYTLWFHSTDSNRETKLIVVACNAWDAAQKSWLQGELAKPSGATIITRHEPLSSTGPCNSDMDAMLQSSSYNLLIVGHTHTYYHSGNQLVVGNGGAPISGSASYGYAIVEELPGVGFRVTQYDYQTASPVGSFTVP